MDSIAPVKSVRIKQTTEEWVDSEVLQSIKDRDKAFIITKETKLKKILTILEPSGTKQTRL